MLKSQWFQGSVFQKAIFQQPVNSDFSLQTSFMWGQDLSGTMDQAGGIVGLMMVQVGPAGPSGPTTHFVAYDANGNITALVNSNQMVVARYHYGPYGNTLAASGPLVGANLYRFSNKQWHPNSGAKA